jgi:hypothetical protein
LTAGPLGDYSDPDFGEQVNPNGTQGALDKHDKYFSQLSASPRSGCNSHMSFDKVTKAIQGLYPLDLLKIFNSS